MWLAGGLLAVSLLLVLRAAHGQGPVLTPSSNQTVPDNLASNVTYQCVIPSSPNLRLFWEVDNLQLQSAEIVQRFQDRGIVKQDSPAGNESTLIVTEQALGNLGEGEAISVQCLVFDAVLRSSTLSPLSFVKVFGRPGTPVNLDVVPFTDNTLLITWGRPPSLPEVAITYNVSVTNVSAAVPSVESFSTDNTSLQYEEREMDCHQFRFEVVAVNEAGESDVPASLTDTIPITPDFTATDTSLSILYVDVSSPSSAQISVSFKPATSCSERFRVANHSVLVIGGGGEVVREGTVSDTTPDVLQEVVVGGIERDAEFSVRVQACNVLLCRRSRALRLLTTDVQSAAILFFETFVSLNCTFGRGSLARGCVVSLQLGEREGEGEGEGREVFRLGRENGTSDAATQCNRTDNSRMAYQVILGADWESDGTVGLYSIPVAIGVTELEGEFPCPIGDGGGDDGLSAGAIAGIVIGATLFVILVTMVVVVVVFCSYHHTRDVKRKSDGAISIEERSLLPSTARRSAPVTSLNPVSSVPASVSASSKPTPYESATIKSTSSLPTRSLQSSLDCGPVGELSLEKEGKIRMHIWSDTLERCKRTGKKKFQLLPLLEDFEEGEGEAGGEGKRGEYEVETKT